MPGAVQDLEAAVARSSSTSPSASGRVTSTCEPQPRKLRETLRSADGHVLGDPVAQHQLDREVVLALGVLVEVGERSAGDADRRHLGAGVLDDDLDQAEVVDVLVGDDDQLDVVDRVAALAELRCSSSSALPEFGPVSTRVSGSSSIR